MKNAILETPPNESILENFSINLFFSLSTVSQSIRRVGGVVGLKRSAVQCGLPLQGAHPGSKDLSAPVPPCNT